MHIASLPFLSDSYKITHHLMYPEGITGVHSYFEARPGATHEKIMFFGLQQILMQTLVGNVIDKYQVDKAQEYFDTHIGPGLFNREGWDYIVREHNGRLPIRIRAVPEGTVWEPGTVLVTVENTDPKCAWLVNYLETLLSQVWYPCTVGSVSYALRNEMEKFLFTTNGDTAGVEFMLHDFGCRGVSSMDSAAIGGLAHLVNFCGTDTLPALVAAVEFYRAAKETLAFSVPATEHSVMTSSGIGNDIEVLDRMLDTFPAGILSLVADSYDVYRFVDAICERRDKIEARDGKVVIRPDSNTKLHPEPGDQVVWILRHLLKAGFEHTITSQGFVSFNKVGVLWGDGIGPDGIIKIMEMAVEAGFAVSNLVFGMGGGLLQKVNRDTERFAFKASAIQIHGGEWQPIAKQPLDASKASKAGRFDDDPNLEVVFENGALVRYTNFETVRNNAKG